MDRQFEEAVGAFLKWFFRMIAGFLKGIFRGIKKLNKLLSWIGVGISALISVATYKFQPQMHVDAPIYVQFFLYWTLLCAPVLYLFLLGSWNSKSNQDYEKLFKDIGFIGKDGKTPLFRESRKDGKKTILIFTSNIPLENWKKNKDGLETTLDCCILKMECVKSKKKVALTTLPSDYEIPKKIDWSDSYCKAQSGVIVIGVSALGPVMFDLEKVPHAIVAGETGSGKSVILRTISRQMVLQGSRVFMIDFKGGVEFGIEYEQFGEVVMDRERAIELLDMLVKENDRRLKLFREMRVKNLSEYNKKTGRNLCRIGVFTDEVAQMLDKKGISKEDKQIFDEIEGKLSTLARLSRATGINLFLGVQRPDANVLPGQIKNNIPIRISGRFADKTASEIVLGNTDACDLPNIQGRFLYKVGNETVEFQAYYFDDETMLHEVFVEVGDMLLEGDVYKPPKMPKVAVQQSASEDKKKNQDVKQKGVKSKKKTTGASGKKQKAGEQEFDGYSDSEIYQDVGYGYSGDPLSEDEELPFGEAMTVDDMDFDFSREWRSRDEGKEDEGT